MRSELRCLRRNKLNYRIFYFSRFSRKGDWTNVAITTDDNQMSLWCTDDPGSGKVFQSLILIVVYLLQ